MRIHSVCVTKTSLPFALVLDMLEQEREQCTPVSSTHVLKIFYKLMCVIGLGIFLLLIYILQPDYFY